MKILIVGAGGYGVNYVNALLTEPWDNVKLEGIVDPYLQSCSLKKQILQAGIPVYDTMEAFYKEHTADLAVISTPTFLHCEQSIQALQHGSHVLCEKPAAPTISQVQKMIAAQKQYDKFIAIGYQWSFSQAIQDFKQDLLSGVLGKPVTLKTMICWPRNRAYYRRGSGWGGRITKDGTALYDSIASNACAHYIHNILFLLGDSLHTSILPKSVEAECLRANEIENFDTCALRFAFANGASAYFVASHATEQTKNPEFIYIFEKATVTFSTDDDSQIIATFHDGSIKNYGNPFQDNLKKLRDCIACVKEGGTPVCTVETAFPHTALIEHLQNHISISNFPPEMLCEDTADDRIYVKNLMELMHQAYEDCSLFSQKGYDFVSTAVFELFSQQRN